MKFLCLHGSGTNSKIFELQTAALRNELSDEHIYEFVEGTVACDMFPTIEALSIPDEKYFKYYEEGSRDSFLKALADMTHYIAAEGPFDAVLAFSQGSSVAAGYAFQIEKMHQIPFSCAIFIAGTSSCYDDAQVTIDKVVNGSLQVSMPTAHIWGTAEENPANPKGLYELCNPLGRSMLVFEGGHEVPGAKNSTALTDSARLIRKMLIRCQGKAGIHAKWQRGLKNIKWG